MTELSKKLSRPSWPETVNSPNLGSVLPWSGKTPYKPSDFAKFSSIKYEFSGKLVFIFLPIFQIISFAIYILQYLMMSRKTIPKHQK